MKTNLLLLLLLCSYSIDAQVIDSLPATDSLVSVIIPYNQNQLDISPSKTIITADEILERGYDNLDELLASVQGVSLSHDRTFTQIGIRGMSPTGVNNQRVQVLLDNAPLNNPLTGQAPSAYDLRGVGMEDIEKVEIIRSSSAVKNGNNAMLGLIKIITKKARRGGRVNFDTGSFGELDGGFALGLPLGKTTIGLSGNLANIPGQEIFFPSDIILEKEKTNYGGFQFKLASNKFSVNASYNRRREEIAAVPNNPFQIAIDSSIAIPENIYLKEELDIPGRLDNDQLSIGLNFSTALKNKQAMDLLLFMNYGKQDRLQVFRDTEMSPDSTGVLDTVGYIEYNELQQTKTLWTGLEYQHHFFFQPKHQLTLGTALSVSPIVKYDSENTLFTHFDGDDIITTNFWEDILAYNDLKEESFNKKFSYWSIGLFVEDKFQLNRFLTLNAGLRVDINSQTDPVVAPEFSIQITPFEKNTAIKFGYSRGYRLPSIIETDLILFDRPIPNQAGTPSLPTNTAYIPETSNNFELGLNQKISKGLNLNLGVYHQQLNDLIWNETNALNTQADSIWKATGLEAGIDLSLINGIRSYFNYNFQFDRKDKVNMPSPLCKFGVTIPFLSHFSIFAEGLYEGSRLAFNGKNTKAYFLMNTNLLIRPKTDTWLSNMSISFRVFNIFDQFYQHPSGQTFTVPLIPQNGRTWQTQLTYQF